MIVRVNNDKVEIYGYIWDGDGPYFMRKFAEVDGSYEVLNVHLHTYGGSVFDGNLIYNALINAKSEIHIYIDGIAASMGSIIMLAGKKIHMVENGFIMIHAASGYTRGTAKDHESSANLLREIGKSFIKKLKAKTDKKEKEVAKWLDGDNWFSAEQAKAEGLIDSIVNPIGELDDIEDPMALGSKEVFNRFAAALKFEDKPTGKSLIINDDTMKQDVIQALGLQSVNAQSSDTAVITAINEHINAQVSDYKTKYETEKTARENLESAVNAQRDGQIKALLDTAVTAGKITEQQRSVYENIGKTSGVEALETVLGGLNAHQSISGQVTGKPAVTGVKDGWDWDKYQKEDPKALEALKTNNFDAFKALFKAKFGVDFKE